MIGIHQIQLGNCQGQTTKMNKTGKGNKHKQTK